jgi:hypothetical protein
MAQSDYLSARFESDSLAGVERANEFFHRGVTALCDRAATAFASALIRT